MEDKGARPVEEGAPHMAQPQEPECRHPGKPCGLPVLRHTYVSVRELTHVNVRACAGAPGNTDSPAAASTPSAQTWASEHHSAVNRTEWGQLIPGLGPEHLCQRGKATQSAKPHLERTEETV